MVSTPSSEELTAKIKALSAIEKSLNKQMGAGTFMNLADTPQILFDRVIPTGAISLDLAIGIGGLPRGKIVELYGEEGSGKSTLALSVARQAQLKGGTVVYVDAENVLDPEYCEALGIDLSRFWLAQPSSGEEGLKIVQTVLKLPPSEAPDLVVIDSVAALTPEIELAGEIEDVKPGAQARMMSKALRMMTPDVHASGAVVIFINQIREKIGVMYGDPRTTPGGRALKFTSALRLEVRAPASKRINDPESRSKPPIGQECTVKVKKNKVGPPMGEATFDLIYGKGIQGEKALVAALIDRAIWFTKGAYIYDADTGEQIGQGRAQAAAKIKEGNLEESLTARLYDSLNTPGSVETDTEIEDAALVDAQEDANSGSELDNEVSDKDSD